MGQLMKKIIYDTNDIPALSKDMNPKDYDVDVLPYFVPQSESDNTLVF